MRFFWTLCFLVTSGYAETISLSNGLRLRIMAQPQSLAIKIAPATGDSVYRLFRDENDLVVYAYEIQIRRTPDGQRFQVIAKPAGEEFAQRFPNADGGKPTPTLPGNQQSPQLASGERFTLNIPTNPALGGVIHDVMEVRTAASGAAAFSGTAGPLRFSGIRILLNGRRVNPDPGGAVTGNFLMFYIPGQGGYFFSSAPAVGKPLLQAGWIDQSRMGFTIDNQVFDVQADQPILVGQDRGLLWVYHDPAYKPRGNWTNVGTGDTPRDEFFTAASDSLNWWLP